MIKKMKKNLVSKFDNKDKLECHYCPKCELDFFLTNNDMVKHLEKHKEDSLKYNEVDEDDIYV